MKKEFLEFYEEYKNKVSAYNLALNTLYFDGTTIAPKNGAAYRNHMTSILAGESFAYESDIENINKIIALNKEKDLSPTLKKELTLLLRELDELKSLPKEIFISFSRTVADAESKWQEAKEKNDYAIFKPHLINVIKKQKEVLTYTNKDKNRSDYDYLLDRYQIGMNTEKYDAFFALIKKELIPFIKEINEKGKRVDDHILFTSFDITQQVVFMEELKQYLQVDKEECYMGTTQHPFTSFFSAHDVRITTHYHEHNVMSAILSTIHEYGHALYGLQVEESFNGTSLYNNIGFATHESQSRFLENHIGRSHAFWEVNYPKLQKHFASLKEVSLDSFVEMINVSTPSLIRTEADELTYPLHILIRYELEKEIFNGNINYDDLDKLWADKYEKYLGVRPRNDAEGILQDMHWSAANLGYFPTYALGSAYAAQFYHQLEKEMDIDEVLRSGQFNILSDWLKEHIHQYGAYKDIDEIILETTKEDFNPLYYINYLKDKFKKVYRL